MINIEYYGIECPNDAEVKNYQTNIRKKAQRLTERWNKNKEELALIERYEQLQQKAATVVYLKMREITKASRDKERNAESFKYLI